MTNARFNRTKSFRLEPVSAVEWRLTYLGVVQKFIATSHDQASRIAMHHMARADLHNQKAMLV